MKTILLEVTNPRGWAYGLFWSWNIIFLAFMLFSFAPQLLPDMLTARAGVFFNRMNSMAAMRNLLKQVGLPLS